MATLGCSSPPPEPTIAAPIQAADHAGPSPSPAPAPDQPASDPASQPAATTTPPKIEELWTQVSGIERHWRGQHPQYEVPPEWFGASLPSIIPRVSSTVQLHVLVDEGPEDLDIPRSVVVELSMPRLWGNDVDWNALVQQLESSGFQPLAQKGREGAERFWRPSDQLELRIRSGRSASDDTLRIVDAVELAWFFEADTLVPPQLGLAGPHSSDLFALPSGPEQQPDVLLMRFAQAESAQSSLFFDWVVCIGGLDVDGTKAKFPGAQFVRPKRMVADAFTWQRKTKNRTPGLRVANVLAPDALQRRSLTSAHACEHSRPGYKPGEPPPKGEPQRPIH